MASKEALEPLPLFPSGKHLKFPFRQNKASSLASIIHLFLEIQTYTTLVDTTSGHSQWTKTFFVPCHMLSRS